VPRDAPVLVCEAGDIVLTVFDPTVGHEKAGERPAIVVSSAPYNRDSSFTIVCPITTNPKPWPFKVPIAGAPRIAGFVLVDQVKSVDRRRLIRVMDRADAPTMRRIRALLASLVGLEDPDRSRQNS